MSPPQNSASTRVLLRHQRQSANASNERGLILARHFIFAQRNKAEAVPASTTTQSPRELPFSRKSYTSRWVKALDEVAKEIPDHSRVISNKLTTPHDPNGQSRYQPELRAPSGECTWSTGTSLSL